MAFQMLDLASLQALADMASHRLAIEAETNGELREALMMTARHNGVRIGACEITYRLAEDNSRIYDIHFNDAVIEGIAFYETARQIVTMLNAGQRLSNVEIAHVIATNQEYIRAQSNARLHAALSHQYSESGDHFRADLNENKFSRDAAKVLTLRQRLLSRDWVRY